MALQLQVGDTVRRINSVHANLAVDDIAIVTGLKRTADGSMINAVLDRGDLTTHQQKDLELIKHKDIPFDEIPDGAIFTMRYCDGKYRLIAKKVPFFVRNTDLCQGPMVNSKGLYDPTGLYGTGEDATFSLSTPDEIAELVAHMSVNHQTTQHHYQIY